MPFASLFVSVFLLLAGFGLSASLVSFTLAQRGQTGWVGVVGALYFLGLGLGSLRGARIVADVGVLRAYGVLTAVGAVGVLALALGDAPWVWVLARGLQGVALGGLYVCIESWLGAAAAPSERGRVLGVYQVMVYLGLVAGQLLFGPLASDVPRGVVVAAILLCLAALPVGSTKRGAPHFEAGRRMPLGRLWNLAHVGLVAVAVSGITTGAVYAVAPAAGVVAGLDEGEVAWFMAAFIAGGLVLQIPLGRASDRFDRRWVMAATGALTAVGGLLALLAGGRPVPLVVTAAFEGGWIFAIYAIALAYTFDRVPPTQAMAANSTLLLVFCGASVVGSTTASLALGRLGLAGYQAVFVLGGGALAMVAARAAQRFEPVPDDDQHDVVFVPRTSPVVGELFPPEVTENEAPPAT